MIQSLTLQTKEILSKTEILIWGFIQKEEENKQCLIRVRDFRNFIFIELEDVIQDKKVLWNSSLIQQYIDRLKYFIDEKDNDEDISFVLCKRKKIYYFHDEKEFPMLKILFTNYPIYEKTLKQIKKGIKLDLYGIFYKAPVYDDNITIIRKFLSTYNLKYCAWFECSLSKINDNEKISKLDEEYYMELSPTVKPKIREDIMINSSPTILALDIETFSHNPDSFPVVYYVQDVIFIVSCIIFKNNQIINYAIVLGNEDLGEINGATTYYEKTEQDVMNRVGFVIDKYLPDLFIGYNIFGFDIPYMFNRLKRELNDFPKCGKLINSKPYQKDFSWESSAYGKNDIYYLEIDGMVCVDLFKYVQREFKLKTYKLDLVAEEFIGEKKLDVNPKEIFKCYKNYIKEPNEENINLFRKVIEYCIQDSVLVIKLFNKLGCWINLLEFAKILCVNIGDLYTRGQGVRVLNQIYDRTFNDNRIINFPEPRKQKIKWTGAVVQDPKVGMWDKVMTCDANSLYPSLIIAYNLCYSTFIRDEDLHKYKPDEYNKVEWPDTVEIDGVETDVNFCFHFSKKIEGTLPKMCKYLIDERNKVKKLMNTEKKENGESMLYNILNSKQLALKCSANSIYGSLGVAIKEQGSKILSMMEIAMCVTRLGRMTIGICNDYLVENGYEIIYGDTDSTMFRKADLDPTQLYKTGYEMEKKLTEVINKPAMRMELEKAGSIICFKKKKYVYIPVDKKDGITYLKECMLYKGICLNKRDTCDFQLDLYKEVLECVLNHKNHIETYNLLISRVKEMLEGKADWRKFLITGKIKETYKQDSYHMAIFGQEIKNRGREVPYNERIFYLIADINNDKRLIGHKYILKEEYMETEHLKEEDEGYDKKYKINYFHYLEHYLVSHIDQLYDTVYKDKMYFNKPLERYVKKLLGKK